MLVRKLIAVRWRHNTEKSPLQPLLSFSLLLPLLFVNHCPTVAARSKKEYGGPFRARISPGAVRPCSSTRRGNDKELFRLRIADLISNARRPFLSLEFFPPKERDTWPKFFAEVEKLKALDPLFVSVTYGAGGGTQANTLDVVTHLKREMGLTPMAHLTCVGASSQALDCFLKAISEAGIENVLALRGDPPRA
jgi:5,10-methylenetetrahydrofolate reductase